MRTLFTGWSLRSVGDCGWYNSLISVRSGGCEFVCPLECGDEEGMSLKCQYPLAEEVEVEEIQSAHLPLCPHLIYSILLLVKGLLSNFVIQFQP